MLFGFDLSQYGAPLLNGAKLTVGVTLVSMVLALLLAVPLTLPRLAAPRKSILGRILGLCAQVYVEIMRGTPLILLIFYIFYVLPFAGLTLSPLVAGVMALSLSYAAYCSELYRAGIGAIPITQTEAAYALGMSRRLTLWRIVLPQAIRPTIPGLGNYFLTMFKDTALLSTIGVVELMFRANLIASNTFQYTQAYTAAMILYLVIAFPASRLVKRLERRYHVDVF
jgi:polar amino acid transport system permease protein